MNAGFGKGEFSTEPMGTWKNIRIFIEKGARQFHAAIKDVWDEVEYLAFETISSYEEAEAILTVLSDEPIARSLKAWVTFSCGDASIPRMNENFLPIIEVTYDLSTMGDWNKFCWVLISQRGGTSQVGCGKDRINRIDNGRIPKCRKMGR